MTTETISNFFSGYSAYEATEMLNNITDAAMQSDALDADERADAVIFKKKLIELLYAAEKLKRSNGGDS